MRIFLTILLTAFLSTVFAQSYVINSVPYFTSAVADRTAGNKLNYSNGLVCTPTCMAFNNVFTRLPGSLSLQSQVFPTSPCTCGGSIRCETAQLKPDSTEANRFYAVSTLPYDYYNPVRDAQNELIIQFKKSYTGASNNPTIALWNVPFGSVTKHQLVITTDTVNANQSNPTVTIIALDTLISGQWTDWVFEIRWAANYTGQLKLYKNGVLRYTYNGPTKDKPYDPLHETIPNFRCGIYKFPYCQSPGTINTTSKTMYFDVIKIGNSNTVITDYFITPSPAPQPPVVTSSGDKVITLPVTSTTLQTVSSTPAGVIVSKQWTQTAGTSATIQSPTSDTTDITGLSTAGTRLFKYKVTNTAGLSDSVVVSVVVNPAPPPANNPPTSIPGAPRQITLPKDTLNLAGSATDTDGTIVGYLWAQIQGPNTATISSATSQNTNISGLIEGTYIFSLRATDDDGATGTATIQIDVLPAPAPQTFSKLKIKGA